MVPDSFHCQSCTRFFRLDSYCALGVTEISCPPSHVRSAQYTQPTTHNRLLTIDYTEPTTQNRQHKRLPTTDYTTAATAPTERRMAAIRGAYPAPIGLGVLYFPALNLSRAWVILIEVHKRRGQYCQGNTHVDMRGEN